jgi:CRP/FNR family cyclic AMP-dependent transcriptional regulator
MNPDVAKKVEEFFGQYTLRSLDEGQVLIHAGENPPGITYLVSGQVRQYDISERGNELVLNTFKPPAFFPMSWALNKTPSPFLFEAAKPVTFRQAPVEDVTAFIEANPDVLLDLLKRVYRGTDALMQRMANLMDGSAYRRVLFELLIMARRFGDSKDESSYKLAVQESDLAHNAGLSRETVSRELQKLKAAGLVTTGRKSIVIVDIARLEAELGLEA